VFRLSKKVMATRTIPRWQQYLSVCLLGLLVVGAASGKGQSENKVRVLFIGNSLTVANDLPCMIAALAKATKQKQLVHQTVAFPDFSLEDHWNQGDARKAIAKGGWDVVVLQQGPSALPESRVLLREYVRKFSQEIRRAGAKPAVYMVWPSADRQNYFDAVIQSHRLAAEDVDGILLPAGAAWQAAIRRDPNLALYGSDRFHPSSVGSFLAAWVIFQKLYGGSSEVPAMLKIDSERLKRIELTQSQFDTLRAAVRESIQN
jgi:hypothetical protein